MPSLKRSADARFLNRVANDPHVRPWFGGYGEEMDLSVILADCRHVALENEHGCFVGLWRDWGLYDVSVLALPEADGQEALNLAQEGLRFLFARTPDCSEAIMAVPTAHTECLWLARTAGFFQVFERPKSWLMANGKRCDTYHFSMTSARWIARDPSLRESGRTFRSQLEQLTVQSHRQDDETIDRLMGACALMARSGQPEKGIATYNRLAVLACGYAPILLVAPNPPIIDAAGGVLAIHDDHLELLSGGAFDREPGHA